MKLNVTKRDKRGAFTMVEMLVAITIAGITIAGLTSGFVQVFMQGQRSAYSLAAHSQAMRGMEQTRAAKWDPTASPVVDQLGLDQSGKATNFPPSFEILDLPMSGNNITYGTNRTIITTLSTKPPLKQIRVECTWAFIKGRVFTNSVTTYRAPDQ